MPSTTYPTTACTIAPDAGEVTPALLPDFAAFCVQTGLPRLVAIHLTLSMKEVVHTVWAKCLTLVLSIALGLPSMKAIDEALRPLTALATQLGLPGFPEQSGMQRFVRAFTGSHLEELRDLHQALFRAQTALRPPPDGAPLAAVVDFDGVGLLATRTHPQLDTGDYVPVFDKGHLFARKGYFAQAQGKTGYQVVLAYVGAVHEVLSLFLDPGNATPRHRFYDLYYEVRTVLPEGIQLTFRFDGGITSGEYLEFLTDERCYALGKGHGKLARKLQGTIPAGAWVGVAPNQQAAEAGLQRVRGCRYPVRVVLLRTFDGRKTTYSCLLTTIPEAVLDTLQLVELYHARVSIEAWIKEGRQALHFDHLRTTGFRAAEAFLLFVILAQNLLTWCWRDRFGGTALAEVGLQRLVEFVRLPARLTRTATGRLVLELLVDSPAARALVRAFAALVPPAAVQLPLPAPFG